MICLEIFKYYIRRCRYLIIHERSLILRPSSLLSQMLKSRLYIKYVEYFYKKRGLEIGGPSDLFSNEIPIYQIADTIDGVNFSNNTVWEGTINLDRGYNYFKGKKGQQYISEANYLESIKDEEYEFLIACHCLEHCANTLKTIEEWLRVLKSNGVILLVLPDKNKTFDNKRSVTDFSHLLDDYNNKIEENDLTHYEEIINKHDLSLDIGAGSLEEFIIRSKSNFEFRCLHHHVFDFDLLQKIFRHFNITTVECVYIEPYHQVIIGVKN